MTGKIVDHTKDLTLEELCERCEMSRDAVSAYIEHGLIDVEGDVSQWRFSQVNIVKLRAAYRVERDLSLNPAGATLALELMSQIDALKSQIRRTSDSE